MQDEYKIVDFSGSMPHLAGQVLRASARNPPDSNDRVSDNALRWHFRQSVLANMKGAGQERWDYDLGDGGND
jgi:hypothetical protein